MSETPKKIWVTGPIIKRHYLAHQLADDTLYIRADLVDGLVDALEDLMSLCEAGLDSDYDVDAELTNAKAALAALKEEA